jgi:hypothetical protein
MGQTFPYAPFHSKGNERIFMDHISIRVKLFSKDLSKEKKIRRKYIMPNGWPHFKEMVF